MENESQDLVPINKQCLQSRPKYEIIWQPCNFEILALSFS